MDMSSPSEELERYRFVDRLDDAIRDLTLPQDLCDAATRILRQHLAADWCAWIPADDHGNTPGAAFARLARRGIACAVDNVGDMGEIAAGADAGALLAACRERGLRAFLCAPAAAGWQGAACMMVGQAAPRRWQAHELRLATAAAERCARALGHARTALELRGAEERIRASHDYLRLLIDSGEEGFYSVDRDGATVMCNAAFLKMLGFAREEDAVGRKLHGLIHHSHPDGSHYAVCDCPIYQAARDGVPAHVKDEMFYRLDGTGFPVEYRARPVWHNGELQGAVCTFSDLTERRRTEQALRQSEAHLASVYAQTGAGISETDLGGRLFRMNDRFCDITGRSREALLETRMHDITHPDDLVHSVAVFERSIDSGVPCELEKRYVRPDGSVVWVNNTMCPVSSVQGGPVDSMMVVSVDISERKRAEEALRQADRRKDEFLAMLAHELRNPMAPIRAAADMIGLAHLDPERLRRTSQIISRQVRHMTGLVDDLLDVSRVTRGLVGLDKADLDVKQVIAHAMEQVRPLVEEKRHHLTVDLDAARAHVLGDQKRLVQVLTNLLNNAAKYTPAGGSIHLTMRVSHAQVSLHVADNGIGIPANLQPRIFDLFTQAERSPDRSQGGLGIGLALVKALVELHGGTVRSESAGPGAGSDFIVTLPRVAEREADDAPQAGQDPALAAADRRRILVVDDNVDAAQMLGMFLEVAGHEVVIEHDAQAALARAASGVADVCILDIGLPEIDGYELAQRLRAQPGTAGLLLIALTGYGQEHDRQQALRAGFDHFLVKPVDAATVLALVSEAR